MYDPELNGAPVLHPPENCQAIFGLVPDVVPNKPVALVRLLSKTFRVKLSTCTVQPVLKFVPSIPLLPLAQVNTGVAGRLVELQVDAATALLVKHMLSPVATALAVITSPLTTAMLFNVQVDPVVTLAIVPSESPFLYTVIVAVDAAPFKTDFVQVPLILTVPVLIGEFTFGAAVHIAVGQLTGLLKILQAGWPIIKSS